MDYDRIPPDISGYIAVEGGRIWYRKNATPNNGTTTPLLIIHGGPGASHHYLLPCLALLQDRDVIFYDQLDSGNSERTHDVRHWNLERFTDEIQRVRTQLGLTNIHILASSWGGAIAVNYASREPVGLASMTLSGPLINTAQWLQDSQIYRQQLPAQIQAQLNHYEAMGDFDHHDYTQAVDYFYQRHLCRLPEWPQCVRMSMENINLRLYHYMWGPTEFIATGALRTLDLLPMLPLIETPTLFLAGDFDEGSPEANKGYASFMNDARTHVIAEASHMPHVESPQVFVDVLRNFLGQYD